MKFNSTKNLLQYALNLVEAEMNVSAKCQVSNNGTIGQKRKMLDKVEVEKVIERYNPLVFELSDEELHDLQRKVLEKVTVKL